MNQPIDGHKYALQMMDEGEASGLDLDSLDEVRAFMDDFVQRTADQTGNDKTEVATAITAAMMLRGLILDSDEAGRKIRAALIGCAPLGDILRSLDLLDVVRVCGGLPFGKDPDEAGRLVPLASLKANDLRLMVFDMAAGHDCSPHDLRVAAVWAAGWIAELGDLTFGQWVDSQRDEDGNYPISSSPARRATPAERLETAARAETEVAR